MSANAQFSIIQSAADVPELLRWIAWAETVTAVGTVVLAFLGIGLAIAGFYALRAAARALRSLERAIDRVAPHTEPILERAGRIVEDAAEIGHAVRRNADELNRTVAELNDRARGVVRGVDERARRFAAVLDAVQLEVEDLLLDAASTARGVHDAAEAIRGRPPGPRPVEDRGQGNG